MEIYDMGESMHAFGVLADGAGQGAEPAGAGTMGFKTPGGLVFFTGKYYVKISIFDDTVPVDEFAEHIADKAGPRSGKEPFPLFSRFPDLGEVITTRFIKEGYRGLEFVDNVIEREYSVKGDVVQVFLASGEQGTDVQKLTESFLEFFRDNKIEFVKLEKGGIKFYKVKDPYEGDWYLLPLDDIVFGVYGTVDKTILERFVSFPGNLVAG
jgi:hypothetical protein